MNRIDKLSARAYAICAAFWNSEEQVVSVATDNIVTVHLPDGHTNSLGTIIVALQNELLPAQMGLVSRTGEQLRLVLRFAP